MITAAINSIRPIWVLLRGSWLRLQMALLESTHPGQSELQQELWQLERPVKRMRLEDPA